MNFKTNLQYFLHLFLTFSAGNGLLLGLELIIILESTFQTTTALWASSCSQWITGVLPVTLVGAGAVQMK